VREPTIGGFDDEEAIGKAVDNFFQRTPHDPTPWPPPMIVCDDPDWLRFVMAMTRAASPDSAPDGAP
jgi:hypothetical protein